MGLFGSKTPVTRVSLTDMRNINNPALLAKGLALLSDKSNLVQSQSQVKDFLLQQNNHHT